MFGFFKKEAPQQEAPKPVAQAPSHRENLRTKMDAAMEDLAKIKVTVDNEKVVRASIQNDLNALKTRAAGLTEAISHGRRAIESGEFSTAQMENLISRAQDELSENLSQQAPLIAKIQTVNTFLQAVEEQRLALEESVNQMNVKLSAMEIREMGVNVNRNVAAVEGEFDDYRRQIYTAEAQAELASGKF